VQTTLAVGSLAALDDVVTNGELLVVTGESDVVVLPTAAAFIGATEAAIELSVHFEASGARVEALMHIDRSSSDERYFATRVRDADIVVLSDGSALHAKSVWHETRIGEAIRDAHFVVAIGSVASVLGDTMIDPRGGAPTMGLGYRHGVVLATAASAEQLFRTRTLLGEDQILAVLGPSGVLHGDGERWRVVTGNVTVTRGHEQVEL
jgi:cyanophycinase